MVDSKELAYAAGLFDGEGSISLVRHRDNRTILLKYLWHQQITKLCFGFKSVLAGALLPNNLACQTIRSLMIGD